LIIDDATMNKRFGLYARVLIDVDLSEQLFESVIVEREGHALSVMVHYEKQPSFCTHCKMLGHDIHSCLKLISLTQQEAISKGTKQAQSVPLHNRHQSKSIWNGKAPAHVVNVKQSETLKARKIPSHEPGSPSLHNLADSVPAQDTVPANSLVNNTETNKAHDQPPGTSSKHFIAVYVPKQVAIPADGFVNSTEYDEALKQQSNANFAPEHAPKADTISSQRSATERNNNNQGHIPAETLEDSTFNMVNSFPKKKSTSVVHKPGTNSDNNTRKQYLHNSFEVLNEDGEIPLGEAMQDELVANHIPIGELIDKPEMIDKGPTEIVNLTQIVHSKLNVDWEKELQSDTLSTQLTTPAQCSQEGKLIDPLYCNCFS